jgi:hypothetical protein
LKSAIGGRRARPGAPSDERRTPPFLKIIAKLVARKQRLLEQLKEGIDPHEREEIGRQLEEIDATFDFLDEGETSPGGQSDPP